MLSEMSQTQKDKCCGIPPTGGLWRSQIHRDRVDGGAGTGQGVGLSVWWGQSSVLEVESSGDDGSDGCTAMGMCFLNDNNLRW